MTMFRRLTRAGAASLILLAAAPAFAEDAHHPPGTQPAAPQASAPSAQPQAAAPAREAQQDGAGAGGMGMMGAGSGGMMGPAMAQMMSPERIEGRIAFLKTELRITDAQQPLWNAFADALRADARTMKGGMQGMMSARDGMKRPLPQRIEHHERTLTGHLDALRRLKTALEPLYAALDDTQKRSADQLLMPGMMGTM
ncbi:Spy/CpxP family protein refolding chaperone [Bosea sp. CS1GBMeth4]|uniref:Spy/CpxP family protein refolding chaperone n=1 Tax=Bosea sp. CS1GBMeth4 TaxID=1892849 RepID=UPI0016441F2E|nr:Spy/CpxP family protein refolding chaperone [Bosea sp. CS1GBMeth4]